MIHTRRSKLFRHIWALTGCVLGNTCAERSLGGAQEAMDAASRASTPGGNVAAGPDPKQAEQMSEMQKAMRKLEQVIYAQKDSAAR